jgi:hypothetical protein
MLLASLQFALAGSSTRLWRVCAQSETIVDGTLHVALDDTGRAAIDENGRVKLVLTINENLKGSSERTLTMWDYAREDADKIREIGASLDGREVIAFLISASDGAERKWYFAGNRNGLEPSSRSELRQVKSEIARQDSVLQHWRPRLDESSPPVAALIAKLTIKQDEIGAIRDLDEMGMRAVPAIIDQMDDRRPLPIEDIELKGAPSDWEGIKHYGPKEVVDVLDAILNQITDESFGNIENGGTSDERALAINGWRIYCDALLNHKAWLRR